MKEEKPLKLKYVWSFIYFYTLQFKLDHTLSIAANLWLWKVESEKQIQFNAMPNEQQ